jgi:hypothetical protein
MMMAAILTDDSIRHPVATQDLIARHHCLHQHGGQMDQPKCYGIH